MMSPSELTELYFAARTGQLNTFYGCAGPKMSFENRLARLEKYSRFGDDDLLFMRVPAGYRALPQFEKSQAFASKMGKPCYYLESITASSLPFWIPLPFDSLTDELLDEQIAKLQHEIAAMEAAQTGTPAND